MESKESDCFEEKIDARKNRCHFYWSISTTRLEDLDAISACDGPSIYKDMNIE